MVHLILDILIQIVLPYRITTLFVYEGMYIRSKNHIFPGLHRYIDRHVGNGIGQI